MFILALFDVLVNKVGLLSYIRKLFMILYVICCYTCKNVVVLKGKLLLMQG